MVTKETASLLAYQRAAGRRKPPVKRKRSVDEMVHETSHTAAGIAKFFLGFLWGVHRSVNGRRKH